MPKKESSAKKSSQIKHHFLLNANISKTIILILEENLPHEFIHISNISSQAYTDQEIIKIAKKLRLIIITHDLDYGEIYYLKEQGRFGVIMLRLSNQTSQNVVLKLIEFFKNDKYKKSDLTKSLVIISDKKTRIFSM